MQAWMVRPGNRGQREGHALEHECATVGWDEVGDLSTADSRSKIRAAVQRAFPNESNALLGNWTGQLDRFVNQIQVGDIVVMPSKLRPGNLYIGTVSTRYAYDPAAPTGTRHSIGVDWSSAPVLRSALGHDLRASLGSLLTVCELGRNDSAERLSIVLEGGKDPAAKGLDADAPTTPEALRDRAENAISVTIRHLLGVFGVDRRTAGNIEQIDADLAKLGLETATPLAEGLMDDLITVRRIGEVTEESEGLEDEHRGDPPMRVDYRVSTIPSATTEMESVSPEDDISVAQTKMLEHNFSQLPVLGEGGLAGVITWASIAVATFTRRASVVSEAMEIAPPVVSLRHDVLDLVEPVERHGYVFVHGEDVAQVVGIVTIADLALAFGRDRRPMMMVEEIELRLRRAVRNRFTDAEIAASKARPTKLDDMTLGAYPHLLGDEDHWKRLGWGGVERERVLDLISQAARVRNALMHFSQDPLSDGDVAVLDGLVRILRAVDRERPA